MELYFKKFRIVYTISCNSYKLSRYSCWHFDWWFLIFADFLKQEYRYFFHPCKIFCEKKKHWKRKKKKQKKTLRIEFIVKTKSKEVRKFFFRTIGFPIYFSKHKINTKDVPEFSWFSLFLEEFHKLIFKIFYDMIQTNIITKFYDWVKYKQSFSIHLHASSLDFQL